MSRPQSVDMDSSDHGSSSPMESDDSQGPASEVNPVHEALRAIGGVLFEEYLEVAQEILGKKDLRENPGAKKVPMGNTQKEGQQPGSSGEHDMLSQEPQRNSSSLTNNVHRLDLLPISPSSRMGKRMAQVSTGLFRDIFDVEEVNAGSNAVSKLHEFAQAAGLRQPRFTSTSKTGLRPSPDHFVTLEFESHVFVDAEGAASIKVGKEKCCKQALAFFFPEAMGPHQDGRGA